MEFPETSVIGIGGLGTALTQTLSAKGIAVKSIFNRSEEKAQKLANQLSINKWADFPTALHELGNLIFITVSDQAIGQIAHQLAKLEGDFGGRTFVHCSGNESADVLEKLTLKGARVASFHPLQTFTAQSKADTFDGIYFSIQGDPEAFPLLTNIAGALQSKTFEVTKEQKSHLHAAAVVASNYLVTLLQASTEIGAHGELTNSQVKKALLPLIRTTLENISNQSYTDALTGPIKRGDIATIEKHLELLNNRNELKHMYCILGLCTVELAESSGGLDENKIKKLREILS